MVPGKGRSVLWFGLIGAVAVGAFLVLANEQRQQHDLEVAALPPAERGRRWLQEVGCTDCHQPGSALRAPILTGLFGKTVTLEDGSRVVADDGYLRRSIVDPKEQIVQGYQAVMPSYRERLSEEQITAIIAAMK